MTITVSNHGEEASGEEDTRGDSRDILELHVSLLGLVQFY